MREVREALPEGLDIEWRYFSLDQVNNKAGEGKFVWDRPEGYQDNGTLDAFAVAEAARRQANKPAAWDRFHCSLLEARHTGRKEKLSRDLAERFAEEAGFDMDRLRQDAADPSIIEPLVKDHQAAVEMGVFGTPTLFFENGQSAYLKMLPASTGEEAVRAWQHVQSVVTGHPNIAEIKRPHVRRAR